MPAEAPSIPQSLFTQVCPNCAYSLLGLPTTGTCPECGRTYDQSQIVLNGWARGSHAHTGNARPSWVFWYFLISPLTPDRQLPLLPIPKLAWFAILQMLTIFWWAAHAPRMFLAYFIIIYLLNLYLILRRQNVDQPGTIQVRLSESGCVQYNDLSGPSALGDFFISYPLAAAGIFVFGFIALALWAHLSQLYFWLDVALIACNAVLIWLACYNHRLQNKPNREGAIADLNVAFRQPSPWHELILKKFAPTKSGAYRLRINHRDHSIFFRDRPVDAEILCTPEQAEQIRSVLQTRLGPHMTKSPAAS